MKCNYIEYHRLTDQMFYGVAQTDAHLNQYTEILRQYLINGGAGDIMLKLGVGIQLTTKKTMLLPEEVIMRRFIWLKGRVIRKIRNRGIRNVSSWWCFISERRQL